MGRGGGGGGGFSGGGFSGGGGGGHIGGGFSGGHVGGGSSGGGGHRGGSSWGGSGWSSGGHSSSGSGWNGTRNSGGHGYYGGSGQRYYSSGGNGLFPPLWWWIWGGGSGRNNSNYNNNNYNNNNNGGPQGPQDPRQQKQPEDPKPQKPERRTTGVGCLSAILILVIIVLAVMLIQSVSASKGAANRTKLDQKITVDIGYVDDELGWLNKKSAVESAMKTFYEKTGVMPYLVITDNIGSTDPESKTATQAFTQQVYTALFNSDDAHFLVIWYQKNGKDDYAFMYAAPAAYGVIDSDAQDIVMSYFNRYYSADYDDNQYFAKVFEDSAEQIMKQSDTGWKPILLWLVLVIIVLIAMNIIDYRNTMKIKKQQAAAEILNANIEDPGWKDEAEDLADKYVDEASELASKYEDNN